MKLRTLVILFFVGLTFNTSVFSQENSYDIPIKFNSRYITNPEEVIVDSLLQRGWEIKDRQAGKITGWLNNFQGNEIILDISYDGNLISFKHVRSRKTNCKSGSCQINRGNYDRWRLYLRKSIALKIHTLAINELLDKPSIKKSWLTTLRTGSVKEKIKFARNIIDLELFNTDALEIMAEEVAKGYQQSNMTGHQIQQYAFYCKALARTKQAKYFLLLKEVKKNASAKKLKTYVKGYLKSNYPDGASHLKDEKSV